MSDVEIDATRSIRLEFEFYLGMLEFLGSLMGPRTEIVLHDVSDLSQSIVAVVNGQTSGRHVGRLAADLVLKILQNRDYVKRDYLTNYLANLFTGSTSGRQHCWAVQPACLRHRSSSTR